MKTVAMILSFLVVIALFVALPILLMRGVYS